MNAIGKPIAAALGAAALLMAAIVWARAEDVDRGQTEYAENCAGCHGADARGAGPQSDKLKTKPSDLTLLAKRNRGTFDAAAVYQMIDGRNARASHHSAEMPIWGCRHQSATIPMPPVASKHRKLPKRVVSAMQRRDDELDSLLDLPCGSEDVVHERILSIVEYLSRLQAK